MKNELHIYPTSRALRDKYNIYKEIEGFIPTFMRMDEFISTVSIVEDLSQVDTIERILYLKEASEFEGFDKLKFDRSLVRFFTKSDAIFKFFEELSVERVSFDTIKQADAYAEFDEHISLLEQLFDNYQAILAKHKKTDRAFIPSSYTLNVAFIKSFDVVRVYVYGYLSHFEFELLEQISQITELILHIDTSSYNQNMQEGIEDRFGISLQKDKRYELSLSSHSILTQEDINSSANISLFNVEQRLEQIPLALMQIQDMIDSGIKPEDIVLLLPDESLKEYFKLFDTKRNLNFAMGEEFSNTREYKILNLLYRYISTYDMKYATELQLYRIDTNFIEELNPKSLLDIDSFFVFIDNLIGMSSLVDRKFYEYKESFEQTFRHREFSVSEWLFLWSKKLSGITIDDIGGGKVTAMGVLESRGMSYEGVVIVDFNDSVVPAISSKEQFLNTQVRTFANLPTIKDRESLQKHYYHSVIQKAKKVSVIYSSSNNKLPSKFLYELDIKNPTNIKIDSSMFYNTISHLQDSDKIESIKFDATSMVWSASRLKVFLECKRKFYYRYIQKIQPKPTDDINAGKILHKALQMVYTSKPYYQDKDELYKAISISLDTLLDSDNLSLYHKTWWLAKLKPFVDAQIEYFKQGYKVVHTEYLIKGDLVGLAFEGVVDRIDQNDTHTLVLDYKTGSLKEPNRTQNLEKLKDFQMSIYHELLKERYQNLELYFIPILEGGQEVSVKLLDEKTELLYDLLHELKSMKSLEPSKCEELSSCKYCDYTLLCGRGEYL